MSGKTGIKVYAPASLGNFSTGLNMISVALDEPGDEIIARLNTKIQGIHIESITGFKKNLSKEIDKNSASLAGQLLLDYLGNRTGISLKIDKKIPINSGLSSNAASAVAGVYAVNELLGRPLKRYDLLPFAIEAAAKFDIKAFPAQVTSILFGGTILYKDIKSNEFQKLYTPHGIQISLLLPDLDLKEEEKLKMLPGHLSIEESNLEQRNIATMISALFTSNFELLGESIRSNIMKERLNNHYPWFSEIEALSIKKGAFGCGFAGLGPSIFIASPNSLIAGEIEQKLKPIFNKHNRNFTYFLTHINLNGIRSF